MPVNRLILLNFFLLLPLLVKGQSVEQELNWMVSGLTHTGSGEYTAVTSRFETSPYVIRWVQKEGTRVYEFSVTEHSGTWTNVQIDGEKTYNVTFRGLPGTIRLARTNGSYAIQVNVPQNGVNLFPYQFSISQVSIY